MSVNFLILNEIVFHFQNKIEFGGIKKNLIKNNELFGMRNNNIRNCVL